jgi:uncharacterized cofD-like protein
MKIVAIGGGTGLATLLTGLKAHVGPMRALGAAGDGLTAIVTVTDNGGSSGRLREEFNILPPGDIRNCLVALAEDEQLLTRLFRHRFGGEGDLGGHSFGNLFLAALTAVTGDFLEAVRVSSEVLAIKGRIFPSTAQVVDLLAELEGGRLVYGESAIAGCGGRVRRMRLTRDDCEALPDALDAVAAADLIVLGPGSLFTSVIPNLLVPAISTAVASSAAPKLFVCNCMTQPVETTGFTLEDHVLALVEHAPEIVPDFVLANTLPISEAASRKYELEGATQVGMGFGETGLPACGDIDVTVLGRPVRILCRDVVDESVVVRHDPKKLAQVVLDIASSARSRIAAS